MISVTFNGAGASLPLWAQYAQILGQWAVAITALVITAAIQWRQYKLGKDKLRLDLFEKRLAIVDAIDPALGWEVGENREVVTKANNLRQKLAGHEYLFKKDVSAKIYVVWQTYLDISIYLMAHSSKDYEWNKLRKKLDIAAVEAKEACRNVITFID